MWTLSSRDCKRVISALASVWLLSIWIPWYWGRVEPWLGALPHSLPLQGFSVVWTLCCLVRAEQQSKTWSHTLYLFSFGPAWTLFNKVWGLRQKPCHNLPSGRLPWVWVHWRTVSFEGWWKIIFSVEVLWKISVLIFSGQSCYRFCYIDKYPLQYKYSCKLFRLDPLIIKASLFSLHVYWVF